MPARSPTGRRSASSPVSRGTPTVRRIEASASVAARSMPARTGSSSCGWVSAVMRATWVCTRMPVTRRVRPDVCLLDIRMPKPDGLGATRLLAGPDVADPMRVVVVTAFDLDEYVYGAPRGGACRFLLKDSGPTLLAGGGARRGGR